MIPARFGYATPRTVAKALSLLGEHGEDARLLAGGHSLLPLMKLRLATPKFLIDLRRIESLRRIERRGAEIVIGALATHYQIESSALLKKLCPLLPQTAATIGDVQVRNRGTLGGSLAHADPAADWPAALLALGGKLKIAGSGGGRSVNAENFFLGPLSTAVGTAEILTEIRFPVADKRSGFAYLKMAQQASGFAIVGVAAALRLDAKGICQQIGVGITGLADKPLKAHVVEDRLRGAKLSAKEIAFGAELATDHVIPLEDRHASADYRAHLAQVYTARALTAALKNARGPR